MRGSPQFFKLYFKHCNHVITSHGAEEPNTTKYTCTNKPKDTITLNKHKTKARFGRLETNHAYIPSALGPATEHSNIICRC